MSKSTAATKYGDDCVELWHDRKRWCGLPLSFTRYSIVKKPGKWVKLIADIGFFTSHIEEVNVFRIDDTTIFESFTNKFWGTGTLKVYCKDASNDHVDLIRIKNINITTTPITPAINEPTKPACHPSQPTTEPTKMNEKNSPKLWLALKKP